MCGIAGIVGPGAERHREALSRMVAALRHRGPDGEGMHFFPGCALGHTRLSIVDLATGDQPMLGPGGETAIVLNGEIYGYQSLRAELEAYPFRTASDTEVIPMLYLRHRRTLPMRRLTGMFAFALWDEQEQRLVAARDRFGEKPFFYARGSAGEFIFASEIKAILASGLVEPRVSMESVAHFLRRRFVHPHRTIYENVHTLPPAHTLTLSDGEIELDRYWGLHGVRGRQSLDHAAESLRETFSRAIERQLVADVPVGAFLSGGFDSSTVVAAASAQRQNLKTISFGFRGELDERPYAREVAAKFGTDHVEVDEIDIPVGAMLVRMAEVFDEPFADSSAISTYAVCEEARKHLKVVLTGDGADELLAGYDWWYAPLLDMEQEPTHSDFRRMVLRFAAAALRRTGRAASFDGPARRLRGIDLRGEYQTVGVAHSHLREFFSDADLTALGLPLPPRDDGGDSLDAALRSDLTTYLPGEILVKADRASMAHGLELRAPFLDVGVAEFLAELPSTLKLSRSESKIVLRRAYARDWPESIRRRGKQGFGAPVDRWLKRDDVRELVAHCFDDPNSRLNSLLPEKAVAAFREEGRHKTWAMLTLGLWLDSVGP